MDLHDYRNVRRVLRGLAVQWKCPVWVAKWTIRKHIDQSWEQAQADPEARQRWSQYFPEGKPTPEQYILWLGHAHEAGEDRPFLLKTKE